MIVYFTYNDQPSGVYYSQVCDVVNHMNTLSDEQVRLFALVSMRNWRQSAGKIKKRCPGAIVWPMIPKASNWKLNSILLRIFHRSYAPTGYMCRGVFATALAHGLKSVRTCFDGRGAYAAEWREYRIIDDEHLIAAVPDLERKAIHASDLRLAVSNALVDHWRERFDYRGDEHVVVPCTVSADMSAPKAKHNNGSGEHITLVYAGSTAGWQSFKLLDEFLTPLMTAQQQVKVRFLSRKDENNTGLQMRFPDRVSIEWLRPEEVESALAACDHGILLRDDMVTNQVASPTKFAEYLRAGLRVIISPKIGDMSAQTVNNDLGVVWNQGQPLPRITRTSDQEREKAKRFCKDHFAKEVFSDAYGRIIRALS